MQKTTLAYNYILFKLRIYVNYKLYKRTPEWGVCSNVHVEIKYAKIVEIVYAKVVVI